jgi:hypothetical protein
MATVQEILAANHHSGRPAGGCHADAGGRAAGNDPVGSRAGRPESRIAPGLLPANRPVGIGRACVHAEAARSVLFRGLGACRVPVPIRERLGFDLEARRRCPTWTDALRPFIAHADELGILVMVAGADGSRDGSRSARW